LTYVGADVWSLALLMIRLVREFRERVSAGTGKGRLHSEFFAQIPVGTKRLEVRTIGLQRGRAPCGILYGSVVGKVRKVTPPPGEVDAGVEPGSEYAVFSTRFGKMGMMVCYDDFLPELARELSNRGTEVIGSPVWGCNSVMAVVDDSKRALTGAGCFPTLAAWLIFVKSDGRRIKTPLPPGSHPAARAFL
jgi:hypothetical protein